MKKIILIVVLLLIAAVIVYVLNTPPKSLTDKEKEEALVKILGRKPNLSVAPTGDKEYRGKYMSFQYPIRAKIYTKMLNGKPVKQDNLEGFIFNIDEPRTSVYTEVASVPSSVRKVEDYPAVRLRLLQNNIYTKSELKADSKEGIVFTKKESRASEKTIFFYSDSKVYSISVQSSDFFYLEELFNKIVVSLKFRS